MMLRKLILIGSLLLSLSLIACSNMDESNSAEFGDEGPIASVRLEKQLENSKTVYRALFTASDGEVPEELLKNAECIAVMPSVVEAAFIGGGTWGRGVVTCKTARGDWTPPAFVTLTGGSIGFQIGAHASDVVLFFTGKDARDTVASRSGLTVGADIAVTAGPVGRKAAARTDFSKSGIFSYASSQGIFAGVSIEGTVMTSDWKANKNFYGETLSTMDIVGDKQPSTVPAAADKFLSILPKG